MSLEDNLELIPGDSVWVLMREAVRVPLVLRGSLQLSRAIQDLLLVIALSTDQLLFHGLEPVLSLHRVS